MSFKNMVVNEIVKGVKTTEPVYKFTYIMPDIEFDDEDPDRIYSVSCSNIKSVIFNKTTYVENSIDCLPPDCIDSNWNEILDTNRHHHYIGQFNLIIDKCDRQVMLYKLSVELLN